MNILSVVRRFAKIGLLTFMLLVMFGNELASAQTPFAVERGQPMPYLYWRVQGDIGAKCTGDFQITNTAPASPEEYPNGSIKTFWEGDHDLISGTNFGGVDALGDSSRSFPQSYRFRCTYGSASDVAILTINGCPTGTTWNAGNTRCEANTKQLIVCPNNGTYNIELNQGATGTLQARYYSSASPGVSCATGGAYTDVTQNSGTSWSSQDPNIATANNTSKGLVTGVARGQVSLKVSYNGIDTWPYILVKKPQLLICPSSVPSMSSDGGTQVLTAQYWADLGGSPSCGSGTEVGTNSATNWSVSNTALATIDNSNTANKGRVTAKDDGVVTVTARYSGLSTTRSITINAPDLVSRNLSAPISAKINTSLTISANTANIGLARSSDFASYFAYSWTGSNGPWTNFPAPYLSVYTSGLSAGSTGSLENSGSLTLNRTGLLYVRHCADQDTTGSGSVPEFSETNNCAIDTVDVIAADKPLMIVCPHNSTINIGGSLTMTARFWQNITFSPTCSTVSPVPDYVTAAASWSSNNTATATVGNTSGGKGYLAGIGDGTATIQASYYNPFTSTMIFGSTQVIVEASNLVPQNLVVPISGFAGVNFTFSANSANTALGGTQSAYFNNFTYRWNNTGPWLPLRTSASKPALLAGGTATIDTFTYSTTTTGNLYIQYCVDSTGVIKETNEANCVTDYIDIDPPVCQGSVPSNGAPHDAEESSGLTNNTTNWTFASLDNGTKCQYECNIGYRADAGLCKAINLSSDKTPTISDTTPTQGQTVTFSGRVKNTGAIATSTPFHDEFTFRFATSGNWTNFSPVDISKTNNLAVGATSDDTSGSLTLTKSGTLQVQHCVDSRGAIPESNETDSCRVATFTVAAASCQLSVPLNGVAYDSEESTGLTTNVNWTHATTTDSSSIKCQFKCNTGHIYSGGLCNAQNVTSNIAPTISSTTARQGASVTFGGQVRNSGAIAINTAFSDDFTYRWGSAGGWTRIGSHIAKTVPLAIGAVLNDTSASFNLSATGTLQIQHCVDSQSNLVETQDTSTLDNCQIQNFNILPPAVAPTPQLIICPTTATVNVGSAVNLNLRHWVNRTSVPDCNSTGYSTTTELGNWTSSRTATATVTNVTPKGIVTGVAAGAPTITATYLGLTATKVVTVNQPRLLICANPIASTTVNVGSTLPLGLRYWATRTTAPDCNSTSYTNVTTSGSWSSDNATRATVNNSGSKGLVTGVTAGLVNIDADYLTISTSKALTVVANRPTLTSPTDTSVSTSSATLGATVTSNGGASLTAKGTCYGTSASPSLSTGTCLVQGSNATGTYAHARTGMVCNTNYYYRGYATNIVGTGYSPDGTFTTAACASLPTLTSPTHANVTATSAILGANVTSNGGSTITARGTCIATTNNPTTNCTPATPLGTGLGIFSHFRSLPLTCNTLYYYRGYAINGVGTGYSASGSFTTAACPTAPTVTSPTDTNGTTTATLGANVTSNGGSPITARGTCYSTSANPTLLSGATCLAEGGVTTGIFTHNRTGLTCGTNYYYKGYATNLFGTGYTADGTFTTTACAVPRLLVCPVTTTSVVVGSTISLELRYWGNRSTAPDCSSTAYAVQTNNGVWSSSATTTIASVTTVNPRGLVTGEGVGAATITARYSGLTATRGVTVTAAPVPTADFTLTDCEIPIGGSSCPATVAWTTGGGVTSVSIREAGIEISTNLNENIGIPRVLEPGSYTYIAWNMVTGLSLNNPFDTMTISCAPGSAWVGAPTNRCVGVPSLVPNSLMGIVPNGVMTENSIVSFAAQVQNIGNDTTGIGFSNRFSYCWNGTGCWTDMTANNRSALAAGATHTADASPSFTLDQTGTLSIQYCVDAVPALGVITEGAGNEDDNCISEDFVVVPPPPAVPSNFQAQTGSCGGEIDLSWQAAQYATSYEVRVNGGGWTDVGNTLSHTLDSLTVDTSHAIDLRAVNSQAKSAIVSDTVNSSKRCEDLSGQGCDINDGDDSCTGTVSWDITGAAVPSVRNVTTNTLVSNLESGTNVSVMLDYGSNVIRSLTNGTLIEEIRLTAKCEDTSFFHTGSRECTQRPDIKITADPVWIRSGATANIKVTIQADYTMNCTFPGTSLAGFTHNASALPTDYPRETSPLIAAQMVQVSCSAPGLVPVASNQVKVNVLPTIEER